VTGRGRGDNGSPERPEAAALAGSKLAGPLEEIYIGTNLSTERRKRWSRHHQLPSYPGVKGPRRHAPLRAKKLEGEEGLFLQETLGVWG